MYFSHFTCAPCPAVKNFVIMSEVDEKTGKLGDIVNILRRIIFLICFVVQ